MSECTYMNQLKLYSVISVSLLPSRNVKVSEGLSS